MKDNLRRHFSQSCSERELRQWFEPLEIVPDHDEKCLHVGFPHAFFRDWFSATIREKFETQLHGFLGPGYRIRYCSQEPQSNGAMPVPREHSVRTELPFGAQWTFQNFIASARNHLTLATAQEIARNNELLYNPYVVCGGQGSGKTHLLRAIANEFSRKTSAESVYFGNIDDIVKIYISSSEDEIIQSRDFFCSFDSIIIDDIHKIKNNLKLQKEFTVIFNHFYDNKKQMIFSSCEKICEEIFPDQNFKARLASGLVVTLHDPEIDVRIKYIQSMCRAKSLKLDKEHIVTLAQRCHDIRTIQGVLLKLQACTRLLPRDREELDWGKLLEQSIDGPTRGSLCAQDILNITSRELEVPLTLMLGSERTRPVVFARQMAMFLCRTLLGATYPELGRLFGNKDHSTVMYAVKKIQRLQNDNKDANELLTRLLHKCRQQSPGNA